MTITAGKEKQQDDGMVILFKKIGSVEIKKKYEKKDNIPAKIEIIKEEPKEPPKEIAKAGS